MTHVLAAARPRGRFAAAVPLLLMEGVHRSIAAGVPGCLARVRVLAGVSLQLRAGEIVAITGPPAAGKTLLLQCAAGLARCDAGTVRWSGAAASPAGRCYARAADLRERHVRALAERAVLLLLDDADDARAAALAAAWRARGAAVLAAAQEGGYLAGAGARVLELRAGLLATPSERAWSDVRHARVAEPRAALR